MFAKPLSRPMMRLLVAGTAGAAVSITIAWAVQAASIKDDHIPTTAKTFKEQECTGPFKGLAATEDGWHFVVPQSQGDGFTSLTLTFNTPGGELVAGPITSQDEDAPTTGSGWQGWFEDAPKGQYRHGYVVTDAGWELIAADADIKNETATSEFNLSHTCPGTVPNTTPSPETSVSTSPSENPSTSASPSESPSTSASPSESTSTSASPSESPSQSPSASPSVSPSASTSPSTSASASASSSPSTSTSASASPSTSASTSASASPSESVSASPSASVAPSTSTTPGTLPQTGTSIAGLVAASGLLVAGGAALVVLARRRRA